MATREFTPGINRVTGDEQEVMRYLLGLLSERRFPEAQDELDQLLQQNPNSVPANMLMGMLLQQAGQLDEAIAHFEHAHALAPDNARAALRAATAHRRKGDVARADVLFRAALRADPRSTAARVGLARLKFRAKDDGAAVELIGEALEIDPQLVPARMLLARLLRRQEDAEGAIAELERVLSIQPAQPAASLMLAQLRQRGGDGTAAVAVLEDAIATHGDNPRLLVALGRAKLAAEDFAGAESAFERAAASQPRNLRARLFLVEALLPQNKLRKAREILARVPRRGPLGGIVQKYYGDIHAAEHRYDEAEQSYRAACLAARDGEAMLAEIDRERPRDAEAGPAVLALYQDAFRRRRAGATERAADVDADESGQRLTPEQRARLRQFIRTRLQARMRNRRQAAAGATA